MQDIILLADKKMSKSKIALARFGDFSDAVLLTNRHAALSDLNVH